MFPICYWNCASGLVRKFPIIRDHILSIKPQLFFVSESEIMQSRSTKPFSIDGYSFETSQTLETRGKSRISCWSTSNYQRIKELENEHNEIMVFKEKSTGILIAGVYHPFKCFENETIRSNFERLLQNLAEIENYSRAGLIILGDFNVNYNSVMGCPLRFKLEDFCVEKNLDQIVDFITRSRKVADTLQTSTLDLVITNLGGIKVEGSFNSESDHMILEVSKILFEKANEKSVIKRVHYLDWRHYTPERAKLLFQNYFRGINIHLWDCDMINERITTALCLMLNDLVPKRSTNLRSPKAVINAKIQNLKNKKSRAYKKWSRSNQVEDWEALKSISRDLNKAIKIERKKGFVNKLGSDPKTYWNAINEIMGKTGRDKISLQVGDNKVTDSQTIANIFSDHFASKLENLNSMSNPDNFIIPNLDGGDPVVGIGDPHPANLFFSREDITAGIKHLKRSKAQGHDEIPGMVIKDLADVLVDPLCWLFNRIISGGKIPRSWKTSVISPIYKKGEKTKVENFRPVCNISSLSKVYEKCIMNMLQKLFEFDDLMGKHQHAYRAGSSTITACLTLQDYVSCNLDEGNQILAYSTDLSSAFDILRPNILVGNLLELKVPKQIVRTIFDFLSNRLSYVKVEQSVSYIKNVPYGCVQGSVLGPYLFNIYMRHLPNVIESTSPEAFVIAYADDAYVALPAKRDNLNLKKDQLELTFAHHINWLKSIGMVCNANKTDFLIFGCPGPPCSMIVGEDRIRSKDTINVLGLTFEKSLKWGPHVNNVIKKANSVNYSLRMLNTILPRSLHRQVIHAHFISNLVYGSPVWAGCLNIRDVKRIDKVFYKTLRLHCFDFERKLSNYELCMKSNIRSFVSLRLVNDAIMLQRLCRNPNNTDLTIRLILQSFLISRHPDRLHFFDLSQKRIGRTSFINRSKRISELIPFPAWSDMESLAFKKKIKERIPLYMRTQ